MPYQNIIFDLGGVIIDINYHRTSDAFKQLGIKDFDSIYSKAKQEKLFDEFEKGNISEDEFRKRLKEYLPKNTSTDQINHAWNSMLIGFPSGRIQWLKKLNLRYRLFLLSNTNSIHVKAFTKLADEMFGIGEFENIFEQVYFSCRLHMRKPDKEIFEFVINENKLNPRDTLFVDDSIQHVEGARAAGLNAEWLDLEKGEKIEMKYSGF